MENSNNQCGTKPSVNPRLFTGKFDRKLQFSRDGKSIKEIKDEILTYFSNGNMKVPGFGHRYHKKDPRAEKLMKVAKKLDCLHEHSELAMKIEDNLYNEKGIKMNIDGANSAILSDMGFDWKMGCGIFIIGRVPGLLAHVSEEMASEKPFRKVFDMNGL